MRRLFSALKIKHRLLAGSIIVLIGFVISSALDLRNLKNDMFVAKQVKTKHVVETAYGVIANFYELQRQGKMSEEDAKVAAAAQVEKLRYEGKEYFWINDMDPTMIMHPYKPKLNGKNLSKVEDKNGKKLFVAFVDVVKQQGSGYVDYLWPKPGFDEPVEKISYVKGFQPWKWIIGSGVYLDDVNEKFREESIRKFSVLAIIMVVIGFFMWLMARSITVRLDEARHAMKDIAEGEGDLTRRLNAEGGDEVAAVGRNFNKFASKVEDIIRQVTEATLKLGGSAERLSLVTEETNEGVEEQQRETDQVAAAINQMTATSQEVSKSAGSAADAAHQAEEQVRHGQQVVAENQVAIQSLAQEVERAAEVIHQLEVESENIGSILDVIRNIADQTNLLALNAAIEAARAGEQGRGFAVVADEVRTLAKRTQESTAEIQSLIERLQGGAQSAVKVMESGRAQAEVSVQQASKVDESLTAISSSISTINEMNAQIATAAGEQTHVADEINQNISIITEVSQRTALGTKQTEKAVGNLGQQLAALQNLVMQFKIGTKGLDLTAAKAAHLTWKARLRAFLDGSTTLTEEQAVSHHHCDFGKWYYSEGLSNYGHIHELKMVEDPHTQLHSLIKQIVQAKHSGNTHDAEQLYAQVEPLSQRIVGLLDQVEQKANP